MQRIDRRIELAFIAWEKGHLSLSRTLGLQVLKALQEDDLRIKTSVQTTLCFHCGSLFFPFQTCTVKLVGRKELCKLKAQDPALFFHAEQLNSQESSLKLPKCSDWLLYECHSCKHVIIFRGSCKESFDQKTVTNSEPQTSSNAKHVKSSLQKRKLALSTTLSKAKRKDPPEMSLQSFLTASI